MKLLFFLFLFLLPIFSHDVPNTPSEPSTSSSNNKVILTIFAGRRQFLEILRSYLEILLDQNLIHEIHLWDFTRDYVDQKYLKILQQSRPQHYILFPSKDDELLNEDNRLIRWLSYYKYYSNPLHLNNNDILIKCDDDIVYIDIQTFQKYLHHIQQYSSLSCNLFFPNIVNNDVCAYIQTNYSIHNLLPHHDIQEDHLVYGYPDPLTGYIQYVSWFLNSGKAIDIHHDFLSNPLKYNIITTPSYITWTSRISINFFGSLGTNIRRSFQLLIDNSQDDERYLTSDILSVINLPNCILPYFVVTHYSFHGQRNDWREWELRHLLPSYYDLMINMTQHLLPEYTYLEEKEEEEDQDIIIRRESSGSRRSRRRRRREYNASYYRETYSPLLLIDDPEEDEKEKWSNELKERIYKSFGFAPEDYDQLDSKIQAVEDDSSATCETSQTLN